MIFKSPQSFVLLLIGTYARFSLSWKLQDTANTQNCLTWKFWVHYLYSLVQSFVHYIHQYIHTCVPWLPKHAWAFFAIPDSWSLFLGYIVIFISGCFEELNWVYLHRTVFLRKQALLKFLWLMIQCWEWMGTLHSVNSKRGNSPCAHHTGTGHIHFPHPHQRGRWSPHSTARLELVETCTCFSREDSDVHMNPGATTRTPRYI